MSDSPDQPSLDGWHEATGAEKDAVIDELLQRREQALSATSGTAALGYELDEDGDILMWNVRACVAAVCTVVGASLGTPQASSSSRSSDSRSPLRSN